MEHNCIPSFIDFMNNNYKSYKKGQKITYTCKRCKKKIQLKEETKIEKFLHRFWIFFSIIIICRIIDIILINFWIKIPIGLIISGGFFVVFNVFDFSIYKLLCKKNAFVVVDDTEDNKKE